MYLLIITFPLLNFIILSCFGRFIGKKGSILISLYSLFFSLICALFIFYEIGLSNSITNIQLNNWMQLGVLNLSWGFLFDSLTAVMLVVVTFISFLVHFYSVNYMETDPHFIRFMSYLSLFTFMMLMLVTANNFFQMFLGWEGVGIVSYLLINFWFTRSQANKSALKAIILNRVGDLGLALGVFIIFLIFKTIDFVNVFSLVSSLNNITLNFLFIEINVITLIGLLLFIGTIGKSAQLGLHMWLPDAMEGPTPVSALIHAATMVTAGVFVLLRCSPLISYSSYSLTFITIIGSLTAIFAATIGLVQNDLKRVIAYSTCSQLGYMVFSCGLLNYSASIFHLTNHAFFKALLFLSAGVIIHALNDEQDMRKMGGLLKLLPYTYVVVLIGSLALIGFPFLAGFYSKDVILEYAFTKSYYQWDAEFAYYLGTIAAFCTAFYSFRLIYLTFISKTNSFLLRLINVQEASFFLGFPLFILAIASIFIGFLLKDMFIGFGTNFWNNSLFSFPLNNMFIELEFIPIFIKLIPVFFSLLGVFFALLIYSYLKYLKILYIYKLNNVYIYYFLIKKWYFDILVNNYIVLVILKFAYNISFKLLDRGLFELLGPFGLFNLLNVYSKKILNFQSGFIYHYALMIILGFFLFLNYFLFINIVDYTLFFLIIIFVPFIYIYRKNKI